MEFEFQIATLLVTTLAMVAALISALISLAKATDEARNRLLGWTKSAAVRVGYVLITLMLIDSFRAIWTSDLPMNAALSMIVAYYVCTTFLWLGFGIWIAFIRPLARRDAELRFQKDQLHLADLKQLRDKNAALEERINGFENSSNERI